MEILRRFFLLALVISCICALIYFIEHQNLRLAANDPQIQMVQDLVSKLSTGEDTIQVTSINRIDMSKSLSTFVIIYDANGKVISSSGDLHGKVPNLPVGVFAYTKEHGEDRFTWEPEEGVRIATVMQHFSGRTTGYVLSGRSLVEVEKREDLLLKQIVLAYLATLLVTFFGVILTTTTSKKKK